MKTYKKILLFGPITVLGYVGLSILTSPKALAAASPQDVARCIQTLEFVSIAEIVCDDLDPDTPQIRFIDDNPTDENPAIASEAGPYNNVNYQPTDNSVFCHPGNIPRGGPAATELGFRQGISITSVAGGNSFSRLVYWDAGATFNARVNLGYTDTVTGQCFRYPNESNNGQNTQITNTAGARNLLRFSGNSVISLERVNGGDLRGRSYALYPEQSQPSLMYFASGFSPGQCDGEVLVVTVNGSQARAFRYVLNDNNESNMPASLVSFLLAQGSSGCGIDDDSINFGRQNGSPFGILGTPPEIDPTATNPPPGGTSGEQSCLDAPGAFGFGWLFCKVLLGVDSVVKNFFGKVQDLLCFNAGDPSTDSGKSCSGSNYLRQDDDPKTDFADNGVYRAWSIFRVIATSLLVIAMLTMVIATAVRS